MIPTVQPGPTDQTERALKLLDDILYTLTAMRVDARNAATSGGGSGPGSPQPKKEEKEKPGLAGQAGLAVMSKVLSAMGPITSFAQMMGSAASGLQVFAAATQVLAATLAPIFLPIVLAAAGALLDLSDEIQDSLLPGLQEWNQIIFGVVVPVLGELVSMFKSVVNALSEFFLLLLQAPQNFKKLWDSLNPFGGKKEGGAAGSIGSGVMDAIDAIEKAGDPSKSGDIGDGGDFGEMPAPKMDPKLTPGDPAFNMAAYAEWKTKGGSTPDGTPKAGDVAAKLDGVPKAGDVAAKPDEAPAAGGKRRGLDDAIASFKLALGPKASFTSLASVGQQAQLAGLNGDPIQQRMLQALLRAADGIDGIRTDGRGARGAGPAPVSKGDKPAGSGDF